MACQCDELYLGLNQGFLNSIQHRFLSLFQAHHWKFLCLLMVLHLFSESLTILLCFFTRSCNGPVLFFFNLLICSWRKLLSWQSWWILPSSFALITSLSELYFGIGRFILLVQTKKVISMTYDSSTSSWKGWRWLRLDLILTMRVIYNSNLNPLTKLTSSSRSTEFKDILLWNISQMILKTIPFSTRIAISYAMKQNICCEFDEKSMETDTTTWS